MEEGSSNPKSMDSSTKQDRGAEGNLGTETKEFEINDPAHETEESDPIKLLNLLEKSRIIVD